jgi:hypothetical protein
MNIVAIVSTVFQLVALTGLVFQPSFPWLSILMALPLVEVVSASTLNNIPLSPESLIRPLMALMVGAIGLTSGLWSDRLGLGRVRLSPNALNFGMIFGFVLGFTGGIEMWILGFVVGVLLHNLTLERNTNIPAAIKDGLAGFWSMVGTNGLNFLLGIIILLSF